MTIVAAFLKLMGFIISPEFGELIREAKESRRRDLSRNLEKAKEEAQVDADVRRLQKIAGELSE